MNIHNPDMVWQTIGLPLSIAIFLGFLGSISQPLIRLFFISFYHDKSYPFPLSINRVALISAPLLIFSMAYFTAGNGYLFELVLFIIVVAGFLFLLFYKPELKMSTGWMLLIVLLFSGFAMPFLKRGDNLAPLVCMAVSVHAGLIFLFHFNQGSELAVRKSLISLFRIVNAFVLYFFITRYIILRYAELPMEENRLFWQAGAFTIDLIWVILSHAIFTFLLSFEWIKLNFHKYRIPILSIFLIVDYFYLGTLF